jgi:hypothetical protein
MKGKVFTKKQESQIKKSFDDMDKDLGIDKLDDKKDLQRIFDKVEKTRSSSPRGGSGGGGMFPDTERVPGKKQLKMKKGGMVKSSASKRADGIAMKGKTKGRMV